MHTIGKPELRHIPYNRKRRREGKKKMRNEGGTAAGRLKPY
jgi:hypothetical protein